MVRDKSLESFIEAIDNFRDVIKEIKRYENDNYFSPWLDVPKFTAERYEQAAKRLRDRLFYLKDI